MQKESGVYRVEVKNDLGHPIGQSFGRAQGFDEAAKSALKTFAVKSGMEAGKLRVSKIEYLGDFDFDTLLERIPEAIDGAKLADEALP